MKQTNILLDKMQSFVYSVNPFAKLLNNDSLNIEDFYRPIYEYKVNTKVFPESDRLKKAILQDVLDIYGKEKAAFVKTWLDNHFIAETATHYSFPKSYDNIYGADFDSNLTWNALLISVAMAKRYHQPIHFGIYVTDIPFSTVNSPSLIEITPEISVKTHLSTARRDYVEWHNLTNERIDYCVQALKDLAKKALFTDLEAYCQDTNRMPKKTINKLKTNCDNMDEILAALAAINVNKHLLNKYAEISTEINIIDAAFDRDSAGFFRKTIMVHKKLIDTLINAEALGIEQITLSNKTIIRFFAEQLKDHKSWWFKIFHSPNLSVKFVEELAGARSGWSKIEFEGGYKTTSPFHKITMSAKRNVVSSFDFSLEEHQPDMLADALLAGRLTPSCAMLIVIYLSVGFLPIGGPLQSVYATDIQEKFCAFLDSIGECERAAEIKKIPVEISLHTAAFDCKENMGLYNYADLKKMHDSMPAVIDNIPAVNLKQAHLSALPTLYNFYASYVIGKESPDFRRTVLNKKKADFFKTL